MKLKGWGINGPTDRWIEDFLHKRSQRVVCNGDHPQWANFLSGMPQGTAIGPILFLIYIKEGFSITLLSLFFTAFVCFTIVPCIAILIYIMCPCEY